MGQNKSETLFELFCDQVGLPWSRVPEATEKRPDYEIVARAVRVLAEVKQLDPNPEEEALAQRSAKGEVVAFGSTPGERIRREVREANRQLKKVAAQEAPAVVVIFNNTPCSLHTDPYAVMTAMQGIDAVEVSVPRDVRESPTFGLTLSGPERVLRPDANTTVSVIVILFGEGADDARVDIFHNRFARCPLDPESLRLPRTRHFRLPPGATNSLVAGDVPLAVKSLSVTVPRSQGC
jgi:hypothetical protein